MRAGGSRARLGSGVCAVRVWRCVCDGQGLAQEAEVGKSSLGFGLLCAPEGPVHHTGAHAGAIAVRRRPGLLPGGGRGSCPESALKPAASVHSPPAGGTGAGHPLPDGTCRLEVSATLTGARCCLDVPSVPKDACTQPSCPLDAAERQGRAGGRQELHTAVP